jgi:hypothetical protein
MLAHGATQVKNKKNKNKKQNALVISWLLNTAIVPDRQQ